MPLAVRFEVPGDQAAQFSRIFTRFAERVTDLRDPFTAIGVDFRETIVPKTIKSGGGRTGKAYEPLKEKYAARKLKQWGKQPILVASGGMRDALTGKGGDTLTRVEKLSAEFGLRPGTRNYKLVQWHQGGTKRMPSRPPVALIQADRRRWQRIIARHLQAAAS